MEKIKINIKATGFKTENAVKQEPKKEEKK
jgi:hypothetical protein